MTTALQLTEAQVPAAKTMGDLLAKRGINESQWNTLRNSLFPGARPESVLLVIDYCQARKLDPMKKPCHIVPMRVKDAKTGEYDWRDVVMPGIYEYRTTAMRTGLYLGHSAPEYGEPTPFGGVSAPEWCAMTMYRAHGSTRIEFPVRVYFRECVATNKDGKPNDRWSKAPIQMLTKVCEAAGLREAFPDEFGGETTVEEMDGQDVIEAQAVQTIKPAERKSEQAAKAPAPASSQAPEPTEADEANPEAPAVAPATNGAPVNVGTITAITEHGSSIVVVLNTGFKCSTKDDAVKASARNLRAEKRLVELTTTQHGNPDKVMPRLDEMTPVAAE